MNYKDFIYNYYSLFNAIVAKTMGKVKEDNIINKLNMVKNKIENEILFKNNAIKDNFYKKWKVLYNFANGDIRETFTLDELRAKSNINAFSKII